MYAVIAPFVPTRNGAKRVLTDFDFDDVFKILRLDFPV